MPASVFCPGVLKTRLCVISWMTTQRAWFANAPTVTASSPMSHQGLEPIQAATAVWTATMPNVIQNVPGFLPTSSRISGCRWMIARARPPWGLGPSGCRKAVAAVPAAAL